MLKILPPVARQIWYHEGFTHPWMVIWTPNKYHKFPEWSGRIFKGSLPWIQGTLSTFDEDLHHFRVWYGLGPKDVGWWIAKKDATTAVHLSGFYTGAFLIFSLGCLEKHESFRTDPKCRVPQIFVVGMCRKGVSWRLVKLSWSLSKVPNL